MKLAKREKVLIGVLAAVLLFFGARTLLRLASGGDLGLSLGIGSPARRAAAQDLDIEVSELRVADLDRRSRKLTVGRDPFRFGVATRPPAPPPPPRAPPSRVVQPPPPSGPQPPRVDLDYLGSFGPTRRKIAVFSDGETIHNAMTGDIIEGKFIVHQIGYESVDLKFVGFPDVPAKRLAAGG